MNSSSHEHNRPKARSGEVSSQNVIRPTALHEQWNSVLFEKLKTLIARPEGWLAVDAYNLLGECQLELEAICWDRLKSPALTLSEFEPFLALVKKAHKQGYFGLELAEATKTLDKFLERERIENYLPQQKDSSALKLQWRGRSRLKVQSYWKARHLIYELKDYFHLINDKYARRIEREGLQVHEILAEIETRWRNSEDLSAVDKPILREMVLFSSCRGNEYRQKNQHEDALQVFHSLYSFTRKCLVGGSARCDGTLATLLYHKSVALRGLERLTEAQETFLETIDQLLQRSQARSKTRDINDALFTARRVGMCLGLGFGKISLTRGELGRSENAIRTARALLATSNDQLVSAYLDLLLGRIVRCRAGTKREKELREARAYIEASSKVFKRLNHWRYLASAERELALTDQASNRYQQANESVNKVERHARLVNDWKWLANVAIQRSRIARGEGRRLLSAVRRGPAEAPSARELAEARSHFEQAGKHAQEAIANADRSQLLLPKVDALMARGQARFDLADLELTAARLSRSAANPQTAEDFAALRQDFEQALKLLNGVDTRRRVSTVSRNPKIEAVCVLYRARCFVKENNRAAADDCFDEWKNLEREVEHGWVRELASDTQAEITKMYGNLVFNAEVEGITYNDLVQRLRDWAYIQADRQAKGNQRLIAQILGISRATLYQWKITTRNTRRGG